MSFKVPDLGYDFNALEPYIDAQTMEIHHDKHHAAYVAKLNDALEGTDWAERDIEDILRNLNDIPEDKRVAVRNNGGGHHNHTLFWESMKPGGSNRPSGELADKINQTFGSFEEFKTKMADAAVARFGSGWAWLCSDNGTLSVCSTQNQDSPLTGGHVPLLGLDVWEHAYYLKYQNRRPEYIENWWNVVNWDVVAARLS